ncbi:SAM-dependent methyltransferase [Sphaerisporangium viridialbum]|uniref:SAM-dependent methyltransferase n=1 Tax=Sphaerisporangium viridialbum TaxID=46189 RepID=UPI003C78DE6D
MADRSDEWKGSIDKTRPSIARAYDVVLNGKDNFEVDRAFVAEIVKVVPEIYDVATCNREILGRGVRFLSGQGIAQFIDLGSGLPTVENTHHVAQRANPGSRVVYVDNDPMVLAHGRALLAENDGTAVVTSDLRDPAVKKLIDFDQPVGVMLVGILARRRGPPRDRRGLHGGRPVGQPPLHHSLLRLHPGRLTVGQRLMYGGIARKP